MIKNKTILLTGVTDGLGKELITKLAVNENKFIVIGRNSDKLASLSEIIQKNNKQNKIDTYLCDLSLLSEIKDVVSLISQRYSSIDIIIHNSGGLASHDGQLTREGNDFSLALNFFSPVLITELLKENLKKSNKPIVYFTTTQMMPKKFDFNELKQIKQLPPLKSYSISKLLTCLYLIQMNNQEHIGINIFDPTTMYTKTLTNMLPQWIHWLSPLAKPFSKDPKVVADAAVYNIELSLRNDENQGRNINYYRLDQNTKLPAILSNRTLQQETWKLSKSKLQSFIEL